jgi:hypothetical protein
MDVPVTSIDRVLAEQDGLSCIEAMGAEMNRTCQCLTIAARGLALGAASWLWLGSEAAVAQQIQTRLPGFQAPASDSLETEILGRLSITGAYQPDDLARLSRLAVLESIATLVNIRDDLAGSPLGSRLEEQAASLWDASQVFSDTVSSQTLDVNTMSRAQDEFAEMKAAFQQLEATFRGLSGASDRAADHLQAVSRLFDASSAAMGAVESNLASSAPAPAPQTVDFDMMRTQAQLLANDLVILIARLRDSEPGLSRSKDVLKDLDAMASLVRDFQRRLVLEPSFKELKESYRVIRRRMWQVESAIYPLAWPAEHRRQWRMVRERANSLSDDFGLPRVIAVAQPGQRVAGSDRRFLAQVDRSISWVDEYLAVIRPELTKSPLEAQFGQDVAKMRRQLLELRRRAAANEPVERLSQRLRDIEVTNQGLSGRSRDLERDGRGEFAARFRNPAEAVSGLRGQLGRP